MKTKISMLIQHLLRPVIRTLVPRSVQYQFSEWIYSTAKGPFPRFGHIKGVDRILHRLYWLFNPRGEQ